MTAVRARVAIWLQASAAEAGFALALLCGWALLVEGVARAVDRWVPGIRFIGWGAFLLLSICGWRMLRTIVVVGFYNLQKGDRP